MIGRRVVVPSLYTTINSLFKNKLDIRRAVATFRFRGHAIKLNRWIVRLVYVWIGSLLAANGPCPNSDGFLDSETFRHRAPVMMGGGSRTKIELTPTSAVPGDMTNKGNDHGYLHHTTSYQ